jgi:prevent-host-death family protein
MSVSWPIHPISDLRYKTKEILKRLKERPVILTQHGRPQAVLVDYESYRQMAQRQQSLEDARDAFLLQRAQEVAEGYLPFSAVAEQYEALFGDKLDLASRDAVEGADV